MATRKTFNSAYSSNIVDNIERDKQNEISIRGIAREINFKNALVIQDPFTIIKENRTTLFNEGNLMDFVIPEERAYRPEAISELIYGTPDLWYIILMVNKLFHFRELKPNLKIKVLSPEHLTNISTMIGKLKLNNSDLGDEEFRYFNPDHTLVEIDDD